MTLVRFDYPGESINKVYDIVIKQPKVEFRYFCFRYLSFIRQYDIPELLQGHNKEAVLIEFRSFPHLEFLIPKCIQTSFCFLRLFWWIDNSKLLHGNL